MASHILVEALAGEEGVDSSILKAAISCVPNFWIDASSSLREKVALRYLEECSGFDRAAVPPAVSGSGAGIDVARSVEEVLSSHLRGNGWTWIDYELDRDTEAASRVTKASLEKDGDVDEFTRHDLHQFITQKRASLPKFSLDLPKEPTLEDHCPIAPSLEEISGSAGQRDHLQRNNDTAYEKNNVDIILETPSSIDRPDGDSDRPDGDSDGSVGEPFDPNYHTLISAYYKLLNSQSFDGLCIKCGEGGQMLRCITGPCLVAVHENCLGSSVKFKRTGYCPFCFYFRASGEYCKASKCVRRAKKTVSAFLDNDLVQRQAIVTGQMDTENNSRSHTYQRNISKVNSPEEKERHNETRDATVQIDVTPTNKNDEVDNVDELGRVIESQHLTPLVPTTKIGNVPPDGMVVGYNRASPIHVGDKEAVNSQSSEQSAKRKKHDGEMDNAGEIGTVTEAQHLTQLDLTTEIGNVPHDGMVADHNRPSPIHADDEVAVNSQPNELPGKRKIHDGEIDNAGEKTRVEESQHLAQLESTTEIENVPCDGMVTDHNRASPIHDDDESVNSQPSELPAKRKGHDGEIDNTAEIGRVTESQHLAQPDPTTEIGNVPYNGMVAVHNRASPNNIDDQEAVNSQSSELPAKRKRHDAVIGKINDPRKKAVHPYSESSNSRRSSRCVRQAKTFYDQPIRLGRRQNCKWKLEEENILKVGMHKYAGEMDSNGNYPWKKILEFGRNIFDPTRNPVDLKDKWRNILKKESKQERRQIMQEASRQKRMMRGET